MVAIQLVPSQNRQVPEFRSKTGYTAPVLLVPASVWSSQSFAGQRFGVKVAPTTLLLDSDRKIVFRHEGTSDAMEAEIRLLLGKNPFE